MRLLHPATIEIIAKKCTNEDFEGSTTTRKKSIAHCWSETLKFLATKQSHPKMFIENKNDIGIYMNYVKEYGDEIRCNLNVEHLFKYDEVYIGFCEGKESWCELEDYFDDNYLFSDAVSLYFKGLNIFPYIFGDEWKKYCPVISLKEIKRQVDKTLSK